MSGFSKVDPDALSDDEDDRISMFKLGAERLAKAEDIYHVQGVSLEVLKLFEEAEATLAPALSNGGLTGLMEKELEQVLKGRLHQAVINANLAGKGETSRWPRAKVLAENILQFDFNNPHARWIRALGLVHAEGRVEDAIDEMRRAIDYARRQGKDHEVEQWEAELHHLENLEGDEAEAEDSPEAPLNEEHPPAAEVEEVPEPPQTSGAQASSKADAPKLQRGFLNRSRGSGSSSSSSKPSGVSAANTEPSKAANANRDPQIQPKGQQDQLERQVAQERKELQEQRRDLDRLRAELRREKEQRVADIDERKRQQRRDLQRELDALTGDFEQALESVRGLLDEDDIDDSENNPNTGSASSTASIFGDLKATAHELKSQTLSDKVWVDADHTRWMDVSTELLTLRRMTVDANKEKHTASKQHATDLREAANKLSELKTVVRPLRDLAKAAASSTETGEEKMTAKAKSMETASNFKKLSASSKLGVLLGDAHVLRVFAVAFFFGMLLMLGFLVEVFSAKTCRFACAP